MKKIPVLIIVSCLTLISGCETFDPYTGEKKVSNTAKGAGIGIGVGAVLAYLKNKDEPSKKRKKRMLEAAGLFGLAGAGIGYYMDRQEAKLRETLRGTGVSVQRDGDNINLIMPGNITFLTASHDLNANFYEVLDSIYLVLQEFNQTVIVVAGHTDSRGSDEYNQSLSERRASSVSTYLMGKGLIEARIEAVGFGEIHPIADNTSPEGQALNRRVELSLLPLTESS